MTFTPPGLSADPSSGPFFEFDNFSELSVALSLSFSSFENAAGAGIDVI